jgi:hypothetical protein
MIAHEFADLIPYADSPVRRVSESGEALRRRLEGTDAVLDFPVLHDLKANGATDYFVLPVTSALGSRHCMATYVTDRPGGFTTREIEELTGISQRLAVPADMFAQRAVAENVLKAYMAGRPDRGSSPARSDAAPVKRSKRSSGHPICAASRSSPTGSRATASLPCSTLFSTRRRSRSRAMAARY